MKPKCATLYDKNKFGRRNDFVGKMTPKSEVPELEAGFRSDHFEIPIDDNVSVKDVESNDPQ